MWQNNAETHMEENSYHGQGLGDQVLGNVAITLSGMPSIPPEFVSNMRTLIINRFWSLSS